MAGFHWHDCGNPFSCIFNKEWSESHLLRKVSSQWSKHLVETCRNTNRPANLLLLVELDSPLAPGILTWWQCLLFRRSTARRIRPTWMRSNKKMPMKMVRMEWLLDHCIESCQAFSKNHEIKENCSYIHKYIKIQTTNFSMYVWRIFHHLTPVIFFLHLSHEKTLLLSIES